MTTRVTVDVLEHGVGVEGWTERWDRLARASDARYFQSPAWVAAWSATFEPGRDLMILVDGPIDEPEGILVLAALRRRLHHRLPVSIPYVGLAGSWTGAADHLGPVAASSASAERLLRAAVDVASSRSLVLPNVAAVHADAVSRLPGVVALGADWCPVLDLDGISSTDQVWNTKLRKNLRRRERLLEDQGFVRRSVDARDPAVLDDLRRLHLARWSGRGDGLFDRTRFEFLTALVATSGQGEGVWIETIERDGEVVAALLGFDYGRTSSAYKSGWDPRFPELGLGVLLHAGAVARAIRLGHRRYDFLRGPHPHKLRLGGTPIENITSVVPLGPAGRLLLWRDRAYARRIAAQYVAAHPDESSDGAPIG